MKKYIGGLLILFISCLPAQFKYSVGTGIGIQFPDFTEFNTTISDTGLTKVSEIWLPLSYDISFKVYPSIRLGFFRFSNTLIKNKSSSGFSQYITMNGISIQTFFVFLNRFEAVFGMAPMLSRINFYQEKITAETSPFQFSTETKAGIHNTFFSYYSWVGVRFHLNTWLALDGTLGFIKSNIKKDAWKNEKKDVDLNMGIDMTKPLYRLGLVVGW